MVSFDFGIGNLKQDQPPSQDITDMLLHEPHSGFRVPHLAADVPVGEPHNHSVLGCVVLVLVLHNQPLPGKVVRFALCRMKVKTIVDAIRLHADMDALTFGKIKSFFTSPPPEFDFISLEISLVFHHFNKPLAKKSGNITPAGLNMRQ